MKLTFRNRPFTKETGGSALGLLHPVGKGQPHRHWQATTHNGISSIEIAGRIK